MKKSILLMASLAVFAAGCSKDKKGGGGGTTDPYTDPYYQSQYYNGGANPNCPGFNPTQFQNPYLFRGNVCVDTRNNQAVDPARCRYNSFNNSWNQNGFNNGLPNRQPYNPACAYHQGNYQLNHFFSGICTKFNRPTEGLYYKEMVLPGTQQTICVEYATVERVNIYSQTVYGGAVMSMPQYPGALIGCIPGSYVPHGCNCVVGPSAGAHFGIFAGIGPFGVHIGAGANAGLGWQQAGICY